MKFRILFRFVATALVLSTALPVSAAVRDAATLKKVDEALNVQYPAGKYDKAERALVAAAQACGAKFCSKEVVGKVHVAIGVIRGKASPKLEGARKAFERAKKADPDATLDPKLVTPPVAPAVIAEFYKAMGRPVPPEVARSMNTVGNLRCTPAGDYEIQTAQPIAVVCDPLDGAVRAELHYRLAGESEYTALLMTVQDGTFRANIPCEPLTKPGKLDIYIVAQDFNKEKIDSFGNSIAPVHYKLVNSTKEPVPSYPGQDPPKRCSELLVGVGALGESCKATQPCKYGLYCAEGICQKAPACETDSDCKSSRCNNGFCAMDQDAPDPESKPNRWMVGLHGALDLWLVSSWKSVCGEASQRAGDFYCYNRGEERVYNTTTANTNRLPMTDPNSAGNVAPGFSAATIRALASVDYVLMRYLSVGGRLGWAFGGGPRSIQFDSAGHPSRKSRFIPIHAEARGTLWLRSLGKPGLHPYVHLSVGLAEVDANTPINARLNGAQRKLDAWRKMGPGFVGGGGGALYNITPRFGVQLNVNAMLMLPTTGLVLEPSLGGVVGF